MSMYGTYMRCNLHVHASTMQVLRAARCKIAKKHRSSRAMRNARHKYYRRMLEVHADQQQMVKEWRLVET